MEGQEQHELQGASTPVCGHGSWWEKTTQTPVPGVPGQKEEQGLL